MLRCAALLVGIMKHTSNEGKRNFSKSATAGGLAMHTFFTRAARHSNK